MQQYLIEKQPTLKQKKTWAGIIIAIALLIILFLGTNSQDNFPKEFNKIAEVKSSRDIVKIKGIGSIVPRSKTLVAAPDNGHIIDLKIRPGQEINQGEVLTKIKNYQLEQELQKASYDLDNLRAEVTLKQSDLQINKHQLQARLTQAINTEKKQRLELDAYEKLIKEGIVSRIKFEQAQMNALQASMDVKSLEQQLVIFEQSHQQQVTALNTKVEAAVKQLRFLEKRMNDLTIKAELTGIVREVNFSAGQVVKQGDTLFEIIDTQQLVAKIQIPQYSSNHLALEQAAEVITPNGKLAAKVEHIDTVIRNGAISIYLTFLDDIPQWIKTDQSVEATVSTNKQQTILFVNKPPSFSQYDKWTFYNVDAKGNANRIAVEYSSGPDNKLLLQANINTGDKLLMIPSGLGIKEQYKAI
ncbi:HlyD family efflux transporter periplasmic adaptor subunit [Thalassomonas viridans]|uniref:HlyD family efflux transporter periplasmic adaptor subunit n=1 Tax=Thalassomonas viridans TaxID=137584 RepID=A0AAF0C902_9GAMM|nr:HlyD family efflux transporter periplasmic adaptor subunit [Thalassomonas viridans]WDE04394.1 HlyD family efflux transporter periplasmic adaptor subunit [Thalassomonas viridans]